MKRDAIILPVLLSLAAILSASADPVVVGSKKFTESYVLGEIAKRSLENAGVSAEHRQGMGGTIILWQALSAGQIAVYPEYTGTISEEILKNRARYIARRTARLILPRSALA